MTEKYFAKIPEAAWPEVIVTSPEDFANFGPCETRGNLMRIVNERGRIYFVVPSFVSCVSCNGKVACAGQHLFADVGQVIFVTLPAMSETIPAPARRR